MPRARHNPRFAAFGLKSSTFVSSLGDSNLKPSLPSVETLGYPISRPRRWGSSSRMGLGFLMTRQRRCQDSGLF